MSTPTPPSQFSFNLADAPAQVFIEGGGSIQEASATTFPVLQNQGMAVFMLTLEPGAVRIPHWHPDAAEIQYVLQGEVQLGMITPANKTEPGTDVSFTLTPGMIGVAPQGWFHYIRNTGSGTARMLIIFNNSAPDDVEVSWGFRMGGSDGLAVLQQVFGISFANADLNQVWIAPPASPPAGG